jgi:hypothetical protein
VAPPTKTTVGDPAPLIATPHERGAACIKSRDWTGALAAFSEAIEKDPLYPNSYLGRAVAHRRLDNLAAALEDEKKAEELGGPENSAWDRLANRSRHRWHWDFDNPEWQRVDPLSRKAALLHTLVLQIYNGGLPQWFANGYWRWIDDVVLASREVDTAATREVAAMLEDISRGLSLEEGIPDDYFWGGVAVEATDPSTVTDDERTDDDASAKCNGASEEPDDLLNRIFSHENRYYEVEFQFREDVENWFEQEATNSRQTPPGSST